MSKILIVTALFPPEPVVSANLSYDIAEKLTSMGKTVVVLSPKPSRPLNYQFSKNTKKFKFEHIVTDSFTYPKSRLLGRFRESYSFGNAVKKYLNNHHQEIDVIYANAWPLFSQRFIVRTAKRYNIPCIIHVMDVYPDSYCVKLPKQVSWLFLKLFLPMDKKILHNSSKVIVISKNEAEYLIKTRGLKEDNVIVVRNWQNDELFEKSYCPISEEPHKTHFMYVGSINPTSTVEFVINTFAKCDQNNIHLSIIGNGPNREKCVALANEIKLPVIFDTVTPAEVPSKQSEADVLILSLKPEVALTSTPSKLTAYLYSGRPVIACVEEESDSAKIIKESKCGWVTPPEHEGKLIEIIKKAVKLSTTELNKMGEQGVNYAKRELSKKENLNKLCNIILDQVK